MLAGCADGGSLSNRHVMSRSTSSSVRATQNEEVIRSRVSDHQIVMNRAKDLTSSRLAAWIVEPRAFICQLIPAIEKANSSKSKFFDPVACPKTGVTKFSHPFDQSGQAWCHLQLSPLVINERRKQMSVCLLRGNTHINQKLPLGRTPPGALESSIDVSFLMVATQRQPDPRVDSLVITS
jgi:hypothetical protein